jgi:hypothetical protein
MQINQVFQDELELVGYQLDDDQVKPGESVWLTLYWQALNGVSHDYVLALQLLDAAGAEVTYWLGRPLRSSYPTDRWQKQQAMQDPWRLDLPAQVPAGSYILRLALFDAETQAKMGEVDLGKLSLAE